MENNNQPSQVPGQPTVESTTAHEQATQVVQERVKSTYPTWGDLLAIVGVLIVASTLGGILMMVLKSTDSVSSGFAMFICYVLQLSIAIAFALWQKQRRGGQRPLISISFRGASPIIILWGVILTSATSLIIEPIINLFPDIYLDMLNAAIGTGGWAMITTILCAPILEEVLFRGIIQSSATQRWGALRGVLITSVIFGAIHIIPPQAINAFFVSLVMGYIYIKSGSLIAVIIIHAVNNAIAYLCMVLFEGKNISTQELVGNDKLYYALYGAAALIFIVAIFNIVKTFSAQKKVAK